jgi:hypothetical protein
MLTVRIAFLFLTLLGALPDDLDKRLRLFTEASRLPPVLVRTVSVNVDIRRLVSIIDQNSGTVNIEGPNLQGYQELTDLQSELGENRVRVDLDSARRP